MLHSLLYNYFMPSFSLSPIETRVLGSLIEKERITPENYPLSLNSLAAACNQSTNREPVTAYDSKAIEAALDSLREKKLTTVVFGAGSRVQKYRHNLADHLELNPRETALICVLLLRGPQTPGELRSRTERLAHFENLDEVESSLSELSTEKVGLVRLLPARPGQKERRYVQLISGEPPEIDEVVTDPVAFASESPVSGPSRLEVLENEVAELKREIQQLKDELALFRKQFE